MKNIDTYKNALLEEKARIEGELSGVGYKNPEIEGDWQPAPEKLNDITADENDVATGIERFEDNAAVEVELEARLLEVDSALNRIETGAFGVCRACGKEIEEDRLEANPAAATCIEHREG